MCCAFHASSFAGSAFAAETQATPFIHCFRDVLSYTAIVSSDSKGDGLAQDHSQDDGDEPGRFYHLKKKLPIDHPAMNLVSKYKNFELLVKYVNRLSLNFGLASPLTTSCLQRS